MKPWSTDASELNPHEIPETYIYRNQTINDYLEPSSHERKLFLIGSKGCGKTLLLRYKAYRYWKRLDPENKQGANVSASSELVESITLDLKTLSSNDISSLVDIVLWQKIWKFAISLLVLRRLEMPLIDPIKHLDKYFFSHYSLSNIVSKLLLRQEDFIRKSSFDNDLLELQGMLNMVKQPFVMFVDRLDQALDVFLSSSEYKYLDNPSGESIPFQVWQAAQYGLLHSSYEITTGVNRHIKIFATARKEALDVTSHVTANVQNYCTFLNYTREELREMFDNNIRQTPKNFLLSNPNIVDPCESFFGFTNMKHPIAKDEHDKFRHEHVFDFLCRHTFERPREVIQMGRLVYERLLTKKSFSDKPLAERVQEIRRIVNEASYDIILKNYRREIVPSFRVEYVKEVAEKFKKNLVSRTTLEKVDMDHVNYLYRIGLLGYASKGAQVFLPASRHIHDDHAKIIQADYYMLHPAIDPVFMERYKRHEFYNDFCIIGNKYPFYPPVEPKIFGGKLEDLLPVKIPGGGSEEERWEKKNIYADPEVLYRKYYQLGKVSPLVSLSYRPRQMVKRSFGILTLVAHLVAMDIVIEKFKLHKDENFKKRKAQLKKRLATFGNHHTYTARISSTGKDSLLLFESRLQGRLITLGVFVYLTGFDYFRIQQLVQNCSVDLPNQTDHEDAAVRFLRKAFFIGSLPTIVNQTVNDRRNVLRSASSYERELLRDWWVNYKEHYIHEEKVFQNEHLEYLELIMNNNHLR